MKKAISYTRYSSAGQHLSDSERRQVEGTKAWCTANGYILDESLSMVDRAKSGYKGQNLDTLQRFVELSRDKKLMPEGTVLVLENQDRLTRLPIEDALALFTQVISTGIEVVTLSNNMRFKKGEMDLTKFIIFLAEAQKSNQYSANLQARLQAAWNNKADKVKAGQLKVLSGKLPFWLCRGDGKVILHPDKQRTAAVKDMFRMITTGKTIGEVLRHLNRTYPPFGYSAKEWSYTSIRRTLKARIVMGELNHCNGKVLIPDFYPQVVTPEMFQRTQDVFAKNSSQHLVTTEGRATNLFRGMLKCSHCGKTMVIRKNSRKHVDGTTVYHHYLACNNYRGAAHKFSQWHYNEIEAALLLFLKELNPRTIFTESSREYDSLMETKAFNDAKNKKYEEQSANLIDTLSELAKGSRAKVAAKIEWIATEQAQLAKENQVIDERISRLNVDNLKGPLETICKMIENTKENEDFISRFRLHIRDVVSQIQIIPEGRYIYIQLLNGVERAIWLVKGVYLLFEGANGTGKFIGGLGQAPGGKISPEVMEAFNEAMVQMGGFMRLTA